jgi:hypothetical protein
MCITKGRGNSKHDQVRSRLPRSARVLVKVTTHEKNPAVLTEVVAFFFCLRLERRSHYSHSARICGDMAAAGKMSTTLQVSCSMVKPAEMPSGTGRLSSSSRNHQPGHELHLLSDPAPPAIRRTGLFSATHDVQVLLLLRGTPSCPRLTHPTLHCSSPQFHTVILTTYSCDRSALRV